MFWNLILGNYLDLVQQYRHFLNEFGLWTYKASNFSVYNLSKFVKDTHHILKGWEPPLLLWVELKLKKLGGMSFVVLALGSKWAGHVWVCHSKITFRLQINAGSFLPLHFARRSYSFLVLNCWNHFMWVSFRYVPQKYDLSKWSSFLCLTFFGTAAV